MRFKVTVCTPIYICIDGVCQRNLSHFWNVRTESKLSFFFFKFSGSVLDNGNSYTSGRHASLLSSAAPSGSRSMQESTQLREGLLTGTLTGQKVNYLDSGYSEEDPTEQVTSCLMKTSSGSIYIPPHNMPKNPTMDSRQEYRFGHSSSSPSHSPTKESLKNSERYVVQIIRGAI